MKEVKMVEELTKQEIDSIYRLIERARGSGTIKKGTNEVTKCVERNDAKLVILADDVNPKEIIMHLPMLCDEKKITYIWLPSRAELGASAGLAAKTSSVAILDAGDSKKLLSEIISFIEKKKAPKKEEKKEIEPIEKASENKKKEDITSEVKEEPKGSDIKNEEKIQESPREKNSKKESE